MIGGIDKFSLLSVPFFIMAANVMKNGGIGRRIVDWASVIVGNARGGIAFTAEVASMFFGAVSGSSPSTVVAIGGLLYPGLREKKYPKGFSMGLITASGSVALLIPPSITAIIYSTLTGASIGELFIAGFGAGIVYGICFLIYIYIYAIRNNIPTEKKTTAREKWDATVKAGWALGVPVIIIGGIYSGLCTPTEASGLSCVYALFVSTVIYKEMDFKIFKDTLYASIKTTSQTMMLLCAASVFAWILTIGRMPQTFSAWVTTLNLSPNMFLAIICIYMLIAGMFIDGVSAFMIILPMVMPMTAALGINLVHLGIVMITTVAIGMFTPPFGLNLFVAQPIANARMGELFRGVIPFVVVSIIALVFIVLIPQISLFLPNLLYH
jgi:C4-dicarboxylate transporter DctM subunit